GDRARQRHRVMLPHPRSLPGPGGRHGPHPGRDPEAAGEHGRAAAVGASAEPFVIGSAAPNARAIQWPGGTSDGGRRVGAVGYYSTCSPTARRSAEPPADVVVSTRVAGALENLLGDPHLDQLTLEEEA